MKLGNFVLKVAYLNDACTDVGTITIALLTRHRAQLPRREDNGCHDRVCVRVCVWRIV